MPERRIPERFLRQIWKHAQFDTSALLTTDGRPVEILSPGILNRDGGPDFLDALVRIGGILYRGSVELHQYRADWVSHHHHRDPKYNAVILHVVFHGPALGSADTTTESRRAIPVLLLENYLTQAHRDAWNAMILSERAERMPEIRCRRLAGRADPALVRSWLEKLAAERMELKVRRFESRLRELAGEEQMQVADYEELRFGLSPEDLPSPVEELTARDFRRVSTWEQLLYEGIMEALGYTKNQVPFLKLARGLRLRFLARLLLHNGGHRNVIPPEEYPDSGGSAAGNEEQVEAALFGAAGLLQPVAGKPGASSSSGGRGRQRKLRRRWQEMRTFYHGPVLAESEWQFFRLRPENFPTVRIAGASRLIAHLLRNDFFRSIIRIMKEQSLPVGQRGEAGGKAGSADAASSGPPIDAPHGAGRQYAALQDLLTVDAKGYWEDHFRFGGRRMMRRRKKLIGPGRAAEIILNAVIPVSLLYARMFRDRAVREGALRLYAGPYLRMGDNTITRTMRDQLGGGKPTMELASAMLQQGAVQLYKFYCMEERCAECAIGMNVFASAGPDRQARLTPGKQGGATALSPTARNIS